jgi:hypothetical protein
MKTTYHIPTEQYGFIEVEVDKIEETTQEALKTAVEGYKRISEAYNGGFGLEPKEFNRVYDSFLTNGEIVGDPGIIEQMDLGQQRSINDLKKAVKRVEAKELKGK